MVGKAYGYIHPAWNCPRDAFAPCANGTCAPATSAAHDFTLKPQSPPALCPHYQDSETALGDDDPVRSFNTTFVPSGLADASAACDASSDDQHGEKPVSKRLAETIADAETQFDKAKNRGEKKRGLIVNLLLTFLFRTLQQNG